MVIGIDASRAFIKNRTGIEEYSYRVINSLKDKLKSHQVVLYVRRDQRSRINEQKFILPRNWKVRVINFPYLWTQVGLSLEMIFHPVDVLFIPAHTVPTIHPKKTIVTVHGLEYEFYPESYSPWARFYMPWSIKKSCRWAKQIVACSENTKKDLVRLYKVPEEKITVVYEGSNGNQKLVTSNQENLKEKNNIKLSSTDYRLQITDYCPFLLFIGRLEERKNIIRIIKAFEILKEKNKIPHKLVLIGGKGFGYEVIKTYMSNSSYRSDIMEAGYVSEKEKWELLKNADVFLFPTMYEGFGLPILEAQSVGTPVVASNNSSIPEIVKLRHSERSEESLTNRVKPNIMRSFATAQDDNYSAILVNPKNSKEIAKAVYELISNEKLKNDIIEKGYKNVKRFSWEKTADEITKLLTG